ncbi:hypothetical protein M885DRAFT_571381 [Pelagophyceae sp. CCMP2097]|nr:hypothetical protein M885DRAFT_571381 [Pelagophyceae sp. CCMP2097]
MRHQWPQDVCSRAACAAAEFGVRLAADELASQYDAATLRRLTVVLPSGTGTTALFLARHLRSVLETPHGATVVAVPCATGGAELQAQMAKLDAASGNCSLYPEGS